MKSLSVSPSSIVFGKQDVGNKRTRKIIIENTGTENCEVSEVTTKGAFGCNLEGKVLPPPFPASATLYFMKINGKAVMQNADGSFNTVDCGCGIAGTTDANGMLLQNTNTPSILILSPVLTFRSRLEESFNVTWSASYVARVNILITSATGSKSYLNVDATLGLQAVILSVADGFQINQAVTIVVEDVFHFASNSVVIGSISTMSVVSPAPDAEIQLNTDFTFSYTSNCAVDLCAMSDVGDVEVLASNEASGNHSKTVNLSETNYSHNEIIFLFLRDHNAITTLTGINIVGKISVAVADIAKAKLNMNVEISGTSNALAVKIEGQKPDNSWSELVASLATSGGAYFKSDVQIPEASGFTANRSTPIRVSAVGNASANAIKNMYVLATVTLTAIDSITATVAKTIGGTTNGASVNIYYKLHSAGSWTLAGAGTVDTGAGTWTYSLTIATAGTYDIKVTDGTDSDAYALQDSIVVASGELVIDNFESYSVGDNLSSVWHIMTSDKPLFCSDVTPHSGTKCGKISNLGQSETIGVGKHIPSSNYYGKKLEFWAWCTYNSGSAMIFYLWDGDLIVQTIQFGWPQPAETWTKYEALITYNGNIDMVSFFEQVRWWMDFYIDDIKIV